MKDKKALKKLGKELLMVACGRLRPDWRGLPEVQQAINELPDYQPVSEGGK